MSKKLNPKFKYYIQDERNNERQYLTVVTEDNQVTGSFNTSKEEIFKATIKIDSNITELIDIVPISSDIRFIGKFFFKLTFLQKLVQILNSLPLEQLQISC